MPDNKKNNDWKNREVAALWSKGDYYTGRLSLNNLDLNNIGPDDTIGIVMFRNKDQNEEYAKLNKELARKGIMDTETLKNFIQENLEWASSEDKKRVKEEIADSEKHGIPGCLPDEWPRIQNGYFFTHSGLVRIMINKEIGKYRSR